MHDTLPFFLCRRGTDGDGWGRARANLRQSSLDPFLPYNNLINFDILLCVMILRPSLAGTSSFVSTAS